MQLSLSFTTCLMLLLPGVVLLPVFISSQLPGTFTFIHYLESFCYLELSFTTCIHFTTWNFHFHSLRFATCLLHFCCILAPPQLLHLNCSSSIAPPQLLHLNCFTQHYLPTSITSTQECLRQMEVLGLKCSRVILYLKYGTVSKGSYTPGAARSCANN